LGCAKMATQAATAPFASLGRGSSSHGGGSRQLRLVKRGQYGLPAREARTSLQDAV